MISDEALLERLRAGDLAAFDLLYGRYERHLFGFICSWLKDPAEAEDVLHETFLSLLSERPPRVSSFRAWVFEVARNRCHNRARSSARGQRAVAHLALAPSAEEESPQSRLERQERTEALAQAVARLPPELGELYHARAKGLSYAELGELAQAPLGTIKSRLHELVRRLREELES